MKNRAFFYLVVLQLAALLLLFPYSPKGEKIFDALFPSGNFREEELIPPSTETPSSTPTPLPLSVFCSELKDELPGRYDLVSISAEGSEFPDELIARLRTLGFPMVLELREDGSGILAVFDEAVWISFNADSMQLIYAGRTLPFFYYEGRLRVRDGDGFLIFQAQ